MQKRKSFHSSSSIKKPHAIDTNPHTNAYNIVRNMHLQIPVGQLHALLLHIYTTQGHQQLPGNNLLPNMQFVTHR